MPPISRLQPVDSSNKNGLIRVNARKAAPMAKTLQDPVRRIKNMLIPHGTLIAVADGRKLELFRNNGDEVNLKLDALATPDLNAHATDSGHHHHSSSANPARHLQEEDAFAAAAVGWLNHQTIDGHIENLIVIAAPRTLGEMRRHYHVTLKNKLLAELSKEMTGQPADKIAHELKTTHAH
jgi:protein required for attachment to host cells